jgi:hypothetical protein
MRCLPFAVLRVGAERLRMHSSEWRSFHVGSTPYGDAERQLVGAVK